MAAQPRDHADRSRTDIGVMAEAFTLVDVGKMHLDHRQLGGIESIEQGDGGMAVGAGIDDDATIGLARGLYAIDQHALVVALGELDGDPQALGFAPAGFLDVGQGLAAVDLRLPLAQHVEIGPVEHQHRLRSRPTPGGLRGQIVPPRL